MFCYMSQYPIITGIFINSFHVISTVVNGNTYLDMKHLFIFRYGYGARSTVQKKRQGGECEDCNREEGGGKGTKVGVL